MVVVNCFLVCLVFMGKGKYRWSGDLVVRNIGVGV